MRYEVHPTQDGRYIVRDNLQRRRVATFRFRSDARADAYARNSDDAVAQLAA